MTLGPQHQEQGTLPQNQDSRPQEQDNTKLGLKIKNNENKYTGTQTQGKDTRPQLQDHPTDILGVNTLLTLKSNVK